MATQEATFDEDQIIIEKRGQIGWITFNNPAKHNATSYDMWIGGAAALESFAADKDIRAIVLTGAGDKAFVAGADISKFEKERNSADQVEVYNQATAKFHEALHNIRKPTIARINGYCIGGGLAIAIGCDLRIASDKSRFAVPAAKLGLGYGFDGINHLSQLVGPSFAAEIFYTARQFDAEEARIMGLVNRVTSQDGLDDLLDDYLSRISANAPMTIAAVKQAVIEVQKPEAERDLELCEQLVLDCFNSEDYKEGRRAFMEKRKPDFKGE